MTKPIPLVDLGPEIEALWDDLRRALQDVLRSGRFVLGPQVEAFEAELARYLGCRFCVGLNSGTDALVIGLRALGVGPGDEVITSPFSFIATAGAIAQVGATPVFVDLEPDGFNLDPAGVEAAVTPRTRAVVPVHLFGHPADADPILELARRRDLRVLEDAGQAIGAEYRGRRAGALGHAGALSLYPTKNLGALGDAGALVTDDEATADRARLLRNHGMTAPFHSEVLGFNSRLDEIQAALLRVKLRRVEEGNTARRHQAQRYAKRLAGLEGVALPREAAWAKHVYHQYTVRIAGGVREEVQRRLAEREIQSAVYYPEPLYRSAPFRVEGLALPRVEEASSEVLSLPIGPHLGDDDVDRVAATLADVLRSPR